MNCPACGTENSHVTKTMKSKEVLRLRVCQCGTQWSTVESVQRKSIRTVGGVIRVPIDQETIAAVMVRDGGRCRYCGTNSKKLGVDHVVPLVAPIPEGRTREEETAWRNSAENLVACCFDCNMSKGDRVDGHRMSSRAAQAGLFSASNSHKPPDTSVSYPPLAERGVGGALSGVRSEPVRIPDPSPVVSDPPIRAREPAALPEGIWTPARWKLEFGAAWALKFHNGARHYGATGDGKACGALGDLIRELPESDVLAAQERAGAMFAEFFGDTSKAVLDARHCFAFFVGRWGGLRLPKAAAPAADPRCEWHQDPRNDARASLFPRSGCPRCKHFAARAGGRTSEPTPVGALMKPEDFERRAADVERLRRERGAGLG